MYGTPPGIASAQRRTALAALLIIALAAEEGCKQSPTEPAPPATSTPTPSGNPPSVASIAPSAAAVGDTIRVIGSGFGSSKGTSTLTIGGRTAGTIVQWSDTLIRAEVPLLAAADSVRVTVGGQASNAVPFTASGISYAATLNPVFQSTCVGCHGGQNNLFVDSYAHLMAGNSLNGPVVTPGNGEGSYLIRMLRGTVSGKPRMPQGGPYLRDAVINKFSTWIQQGAANN